MNVLEYKGYYTKVEYSTEDQILYGKIEGIADFVNFECEKPCEVEDAFHEAVDDYLIFCEDVGKTPNKPYKGSFNVRISSELHRKADLEAAKNGISLNQFVAQAIEEKVKQSGAKSQTKTEIYVTCPIPWVAGGAFSAPKSLETSEKRSVEYAC